MNALRALLALVVVAPALAGCLGGSVDPAGADDPASLVSEAIFDKVLSEATPIVSFDGIVLDAYVFRPDVPEGTKVPVIINYSPYWSNLAPPVAERGDAFSQYLVDHFVPRGYAVALVSARGTGLSEGCFTIGGPTEVQDIDLVATFLAEQEWSNGNVAATGKSYDGTMANALLTTGNPHVKTIVPVSPISEFYKYNYANGVPYIVNGHAFNTYYVAETSLSQDAPPLDGDPTGVDPTDPTYTKLPTRFCAEAVDVQRAQYESLLTGTYTEYWHARNYSALLPDTIDASVFLVHGLQDWNVKPDHMVPWLDELYARNVTVKMELGQWAHEYSTRGDWNMTFLRWLDHHLKGVDTGILDEPLVHVEDNAGIWRAEDEWPVARATRLVLFPDAGGAFADAAPAASDAAYKDDPTGRALVNGLALPAPVYERVFDQETRIVGAPVLHATVSSTGPRATLAATLYVDDVPVDEAFLDLLHHETLDEATPMVPGSPVDVVVAFYPQDIVIPAGSTLRLELAHEGGGMAGAVPWPTSSIVTIHHGEGTRLELPVIDGADVRVEDPQPEDVGCWAC